MIVARMLAAAAVAVTVPVVPLAAPADAAPCPDVELVFARGTSEGPGIGRVGEALADTLRPQLGSRSLGIYPVNYPATYDFLTAADGATDATNHIAAMAADCPNTRIVLGGYSQGAAVVDMLVGVPPLGNRIGEVGSAPPLPGSLAGNVAAVAVFGVATLVFALSTQFALSLAALVVLGASDMISVVIRASLVQLETPDEMRGRVSAVNSIFIGASNQFGEFESGLTAALFGTVPAAALGGLGTLLVVLVWMRLFPDLRRRERLLETGIG